MADDLDLARLLVQRRGDARRDRLECVKHRRLSGIEQDEIADPDDDEARGLIRRHLAGGLFGSKRVANSLQLGDAIRRWRRGRRRRWRDDLAFQFDLVRRMQREAPTAAALLAVRRQPRPQGNEARKQQRGGNGGDQPNRDSNAPLGDWRAPGRANAATDRASPSDEPGAAVRKGCAGSCCSAATPPGEVRCMPWKPSARQACCSSSTG